MRYLSLFSTLASLAFTANAVKVGDAIPKHLELHSGFPPEIPGYLTHQDELRAAGIDEVIVYCVNDGAVMQAWAADQEIEGSLLSFMGDPYSIVTRALEMELTHPGPQGVGLINRCKRFALYIVDGKVKSVRVSEKEDDPAGDDFPEDTCAPAMLKIISGSSDEL